MLDGVKVITQAPVVLFDGDLGCLLHSLGVNVAHDGRCQKKEQINFLLKMFSLADINYT